MQTKGRNVFEYEDGAIHDLNFNNAPLKLSVIVFPLGIRNSEIREWLTNILFTNNAV